MNGHSARKNGQCCKLEEKVDSDIFCCFTTQPLISKTATCDSRCELCVVKSRQIKKVQSASDYDSFERTKIPAASQHHTNTRQRNFHFQEHTAPSVFLPPHCERAKPRYYPHREPNYRECAPDLPL
jgi:hypothetical protein